MRNKNLLLGLGLLGVFSAGYAASPYTGVPIHTEGEQDLYLYQVESGLFLHNNENSNPTLDWTTRAHLHQYGLDWGIIAVAGEDADGNAIVKYQIDPKFDHNNSLNIDNHYLDTGNPVSYWSIAPVTVEGVPNAYTITALEGSGFDATKPGKLGEVDGMLGDYGVEVTGDTWQFVTREERINMAKQQVANGPVDVTWLVPGHDFATADRRAGDNTEYRTRRAVKKETRNQVGNVTSGGDSGDPRCNRVREAWHMIEDYQDFVVIKGLPNGTYRFRVQGYYRDGDAIDPEWDADFWTRYDEGTSARRAEYFANGETKKIKLITDEAFKDETPFDGNFAFNEERGLYIPNGLLCASHLFFYFPDSYQNEWITTTVTDGTLVLGVEKKEASDHDWLVYDNWQLEYVNTAVDTPSSAAIAAEIASLIEEAKSIPTTDGVKAVIAQAEEALAGGNIPAMRVAALDLGASIASVKDAASIITTYNDVKARCHDMDLSEAEALFNASFTKAGFQEALDHLRILRRRALAEKQEDVFKGAKATTGDFYIYNVGQKQFLQGGSDWGAHAALGYIGQLMTLETDEDAEADIAAGTFHINTHLQYGVDGNGEPKYYLNYRGYCDCAKAGKWLFTPVEGKENVYHITQADYEGVYWAWDPYSSTDNTKRDETNVGTEHRGVLDPNDLNAQWKLVTLEERKALIEKASLENPVDVSYLIQNPGFNQRAPIDMWTLAHDGGGNSVIANRGACDNDFVFESWNSGSCTVSTILEDMPVGTYMMSATAFFRYGSHTTCVDNEFAPGPYLFGGTEFDDVQDVPDILDERYLNFCPGEFGNATNEAGETFYFPQWPAQAAMAFRMGAYKTYLAIENDGVSADFEIGIMKDQKGVDDEWLVADNFRLLYYGADASKDVVKAEAEALNGIEEVVISNPAAAATDGRVYNLQGIQVAQPTAPGIYISNGKKFVVK